MDNIAEFILQTAEEAKRRGLEICIASVQVAPQKPENKPAVEPAEAPESAKDSAIEEHSWMKVAEAARMLRVSSSVIYRRIRTGEMRGKKNDRGIQLVHTDVLNGIPNPQPRSGWHTPIIVKCRQTGGIYPSLNAAAKALKLPYEELRRAIQTGSPCRGLKFDQLPVGK